MIKYRENDFKLGCLHGKIQAEKEKSEAHIQRLLFLSQRMQIWKKKDLAPIVRIFAYEIPLENRGRGKCVDLMGYDKEHNLYLIELKKEKSMEALDTVIEQINGYAEIVKTIQPSLEKEFRDTFFFPANFKFTSIKKMIIAPRGFFKNKQSKKKDSTIDYCFYRDRDITQRKPKDIINIHLVRK